MSEEKQDWLCWIERADERGAEFVGSYYGTVDEVISILRRGAPLHPYEAIVLTKPGYDLPRRRARILPDLTFEMTVPERNGLPPAAVLFDEGV